MLFRSGRLFLIPLVLVTFPIGVFAHAYSNQLLIVTYYLLGFFTLFLLYFFRDPIRELPRNPNAFVSPADGKIISIKTIDDEHAGKSSIEISIYLAQAIAPARRVRGVQNDDGLYAYQEKQ